jgi:hypothetical protein
MSDTIVHEFETISRAEIFDALIDSYDRAKALAAGDARWSSALDRAYAFALEAETFEYDLGRWAVRVQSASHPSVFYTSNGTCNCEAGARGLPCWHRALARLIRRAVEGTLAEFAAAWDAAAEQARGPVQRERAAAIQAAVDELFPAKVAA